MTATAPLGIMHPIGVHGEFGQIDPPNSGPLACHLVYHWRHRVTHPKTEGAFAMARNKAEDTTTEVNETPEGEQPTPEENTAPEKITSEKFYALSLEEQKDIRKVENISTTDIPLSIEEKGERFNELMPPLQQLISQLFGEIADHNANVDVVRSADPEKALQLMHEKRDANPWNNVDLGSINAERDRLMELYEAETKKANELVEKLMASEIKTPEQITAAREEVGKSSAVISQRKKFLSDYETQMSGMGLCEAGYLTDLIPEVKNLKGIKTGLPSKGISGTPGNNPRVQLDEFHVMNDQGEWKLIAAPNGKSNAGMVAKELTNQLHGRGAISSTEVTTAFYDGYNAANGTQLTYNSSSDVKPGIHEFEMTFDIPAKTDPNGNEISPAKQKVWKLKGVKNAS